MRRSHSTGQRFLSGSRPSNSTHQRPRPHRSCQLPGGRVGSLQWERNALCSVCSLCQTTRPDSRHPGNSGPRGPAGPNRREAAARRMSRGVPYTGTQCDRQPVRPGATGAIGRPAERRRCLPRRGRLRVAFQRRQPAPAPAIQPGIAPRGSTSGRPERRRRRDLRTGSPAWRRSRPAWQPRAPAAPRARRQYPEWQRSGWERRW